MKNINRIKPRKRAFGWVWMFTAILLVISAYQYHEAGGISWHRSGLEYFNKFISNVVHHSNKVLAEETRSASGPDTALSASEYDLAGRVVEIMDGDSLVLRTGGGYEFEIRLHGIDAPEKTQPHSNRASRALSRMIDDQQVSLLVKDKDSYGRLVSVIYHDGRNINLAMVTGGHAWWYRQYARSDEGLAGAEAEARENEIGLWAGEDPIPPWNWRRSGR